MPRSDAGAKNLRVTSLGVEEIIDPRDTRNVLGFALSVCKDGDARVPRPIQFGVARP